MNDHPVSSTTTYNEHENNDSMTTTISQQQQHQSNPDVVTNHDHRHHVSIYQLQQSSKELCRVALDAFVSTVQQILQSAKDDDERRQLFELAFFTACRRNASREVLMELPLVFKQVHKNREKEVPVPFLGEKTGSTRHALTPLHLAADVNRTEVMQTLLRMGLKPNSLNRSLQTPLHIAAQRGNEEAVDVLLEHKANVNMQSVLLKTPLLVAVETGHVDIALKLLKHGASPDLADDLGRNANDVAWHTLSKEQYQKLESSLQSTHEHQTTQTSTNIDGGSAFLKEKVEENEDDLKSMVSKLHNQYSVRPEKG